MSSTSRTSDGAGRPVATRLDTATRVRAQALAQQLGLNMSGLLSQALLAYLARQDHETVVAEISAAAAAVRDAVALLNARDTGLAERIVALTEAIKSSGSERL